ncbi:MAG: hypothetical protein Q8P67_28910 [archaeon]|nr:hypothetical protein [archaeon]
MTAVLSAPALGELDDLGLITTAEDSQGASSSLDAAEASIRRPLVHYEWDGPLPHVIGTKEFQEDEFCGLYIAPFEEEPGVLSDISANNLSDLEEYNSDQEMFGEPGFSSVLPPPPPPEGMLPIPPRQGPAFGSDEESSEDGGGLSASGSRSGSGEGEGDDWGEEDPKRKKPLSLQDEISAALAGQLSGQKLPSSLKKNRNAADATGSAAAAAQSGVQDISVDSEGEDAVPGKQEVVIKAPKAGGSLFDSLDAVDDEALDAMISGGKPAASGALKPALKAKSFMDDLDDFDDLEQALPAAKGPAKGLASAATGPKKPLSLFDSLDDQFDDENGDLFSSSAAKPQAKPTSTKPSSTIFDALLDEDGASDPFSVDAGAKTTLDRVKALGGKSMLPVPTAAVKPAATVKPASGSPKRTPTAPADLFSEDFDLGDATPAPPKTALDRIKALGGQSMIPPKASSTPAATKASPQDPPQAAPKASGGDLFDFGDDELFDSPAIAPAAKPAETQKPQPQNGAKAAPQSSLGLFDEPLDEDDLFSGPPKATPSQQQQPASKAPAPLSKPARQPKPSNSLFDDDFDVQGDDLFNPPSKPANPAAASAQAAAPAKPQQANTFDSLFDELDSNDGLFSLPDQPVVAAAAPAKTNASTQGPKPPAAKAGADDDFWGAAADFAEPPPRPRSAAAAGPAPTPTPSNPPVTQKATPAPTSQKADHDFWGGGDDDLFDTPKTPVGAASLSAHNTPKETTPAAVTPAPASTTKPPAFIDDDFWDNSDDEEQPPAATAQPAPAITKPAQLKLTTSQPKSGSKISQLQNQLSLDVGALAPGAAPAPRAAALSSSESPSTAHPGEPGVLVHLTKGRPTSAKKRPPSRRARAPGKAASSTTTRSTPQSTASRPTLNAPLTNVDDLFASPTNVPQARPVVETPKPTSSETPSKPKVDSLFSETDSFDAIFDVAPTKTQEQQRMADLAKLNNPSSLKERKRVEQLEQARQAVLKTIDPAPANPPPFVATPKTPAAADPDDDLLAPIVLTRKSRPPVDDILASLEVPVTIPSTAPAASLPKAGSRPALVFDDDTDLFADPLANASKPRVNKNIFDDII